MNINDLSTEQYLRKPVVNTLLAYRSRLVDLILSNGDKKLITISAPGGFGKTSLIWQAMQAAPRNNYIYINCSEKIQSPFQFLAILLKGFKKVLRTKDISLESILKEYESKGHFDDALCELFADMLIRLAEKKTTNRHFLILDDYQAIEKNRNSSHAEQIILKILNSSLENLTFIISGREKPGINISALKAKRMVYQLEKGELKFNCSEIEELIRVCYGVETETDAAEYLEQKLMGWASLIHLVLQRGTNWLKEIENIKTEEIFPYLASDITAGMEPDLKEFVKKTSVLDYFTSEEANRLCGINNSIEIVRRLEKQNVFIDVNRDATDTEYFTYSKIYNEYFKHLIKQEHTSDDVNSKAAELYRNRNDYPQYLMFTLRTVNAENAMNSFLEKTSEYLCTNNFSEYEKCINILKQSSVNRAIIKLHEIRLNIGKGIKTDKPELDTELTGSSKILSLLVTAEYSISDNGFDESMQLLKEVKSSGVEPVTGWYADIISARAYYRAGEKYYDKTLEICMNLTGEGIPSYIKKEAFFLLANLNNNFGRIDSAIKYYESALKLSERNISAVKLISNLIELYSITGKYSKAYRHLLEIKKIYQNINIPVLESIINRAETNFFRYSGHFDKVIELLFRSIEIEDVRNNNMMMTIKYLEIVQAYLDSGELPKSAEYLGLAGFYYSKCRPNEHIDILFKYFECLANPAFQNSEEILLSTIEWHKQYNILKPLGIFYYQLAECSIRNNNYNSTAGYITFSIEFLKKQNNISFLENCFNKSRVVFDFALANNIQPKFLKQSSDALFLKMQTSYPEYNIDIAAEEILKLFDVRLDCFGKTDLYLRGVLIDEDKWIRKKSKILLVFLMSDPTRIHTKDEIMDIFFDDLPADKVDVVYHSAIYNIRTALKIYDIKSDKPKRSKDKTYDYNPQYILYEDKTLRLNPDFYYISESVEFEKHYNKTRLPALSNEEKITHSVKAIEMYKGDFLPGYYDSWCEELRVKYKNMYITLCEELIKLLESESKYEEVIKYSELLLNEDKLNDSAHISIINAHTKLGNIKMAKSRYEIMLKIYDDELGEKPQPKSLDKIMLILS